MMRFLVCTIACFVLTAPAAHAQNSAISSHFNFNDSVNADIMINQVRVPGAATLYTYYETLGWWGTASGYAGIQEHPGGKNFIFSIWDNPAHTAPIAQEYVGFGTTTEGFGGEGTGLKSVNFNLGWQVDTWYTFVARAWPVGNNTHYAYWVRDGVDGTWRHLVTMNVAVANSVFEAGNDSFIEDWLDTGQNVRETNLRKGWKRQLNGTWLPVTSGRYSIVTADGDPGGRSENYATNWDGGVKVDGTGEYYYMIAGGAGTVPTTTNGTWFSIARTDAVPNMAAGAVATSSLQGEDTNTLTVSWDIVSSGLPQFGYSVDIYDNPALSGVPLLSTQGSVPQTRSVQMDISSLNPVANAYYVATSMVDVFDQASAPRVNAFGNGAIDPNLIFSDGFESGTTSAW